MAIRKIARMGHPVLREVSEPIADPADSEIARLAQDLIDTCRRHRRQRHRRSAGVRASAHVRLPGTHRSDARRREHAGHSVDRLYQPGRRAAGTNAEALHRALPVVARFVRTGDALYAHTVQLDRFERHADKPEFAAAFTRGCYSMSTTTWTATCTRCGCRT